MRQSLPCKECRTISENCIITGLYSAEPASNTACTVLLLVQSKAGRAT